MTRSISHCVIRSAMHNKDMDTTMKAIERTEEIYGELCDDLRDGATIQTAADLAATECGIEDRAAFIRGYVATRRHLQNLAPARDPFEGFGA